MNKRVNIPEQERAFVLQGGGSLGAYGAGVYSGLYESLSKMDIEEGNKGKPIFDIIAGTSIGAINAATIDTFKDKKIILISFIIFVDLFVSTLSLVLFIHHIVVGHTCL